MLRHIKGSARIAGAAWHSSHIGRIHLRSLCSKSTSGSAPQIPPQIPEPIELDFDSSSRLVDVRNTQRRFPIDEEVIRRNVALIKASLGVSSFRVHVWFCSEPKMRELNDDWRNKRESTDVLSFPAYDFVAPGVFDPEAALAQDLALALTRRTAHTSPGQNAERLLGDIVLAPSYIHRQMLADQAALQSQIRSDAGQVTDDIDTEGERGVTRALSQEFRLERRLTLLLLHGMLHLLGYDHDRDADWRVMVEKEEEILKKLHWH